MGSPGHGQGNVTNWEVSQIADTPELLEKTKFYRAGEVVAEGALPK
jgi:hypothetical protein